MCLYNGYEVREFSELREEYFKGLDAVCGDINVTWTWNCEVLIYQTALTSINRSVSNGYQTIKLHK